MSANQPPRTDDEFAGYAGFDGEDGRRGGRRRALRYAVPVAVATVAAGSIGLGTALATTGGGPDLPSVTAAQLLAKVAAAHTDTGSGDVRVSSDFGLPDGLMNAAASMGRDAGADGKLPALLTGSHTLTVAADGPARQRLNVDGSRYQVVRDGTAMWTYDRAAHAAHHTTGLPAGGHPETTAPATPAQAADEVLHALAPSTVVSVDGTATVAGRSAYELVLTPKQTGSTVGSVRIAVDAAKGVPLSFTALPAGGGDPLVDIAWTRISFARPAAGTFAFTAPHGTHVTEVPAGHHTAHSPFAGLPMLTGGAAKHSAGAPDGTAKGGTKIIGKGWASVAELQVPHQGVNHKGAAGGAGAFGAFGKPVKGAFGSGTVISTRLVNVLITDHGGVYAGAVTPDVLVKAADQG